MTRTFTHDEDVVALIRQIFKDGLGFNSTFVDDDVRFAVALAQRAVLGGLATDLSHDRLVAAVAAAKLIRESGARPTGSKPDEAPPNRVNGSVGRDELEGAR